MRRGRYDRRRLCFAVYVHGVEADALGISTMRGVKRPFVTATLAWESMVRWPLRTDISHFLSWNCPCTGRVPGVVCGRAGSLILLTCTSQMNQVARHLLIRIGNLKDTLLRLPFVPFLKINFTF